MENDIDTAKYYEQSFDMLIKIESMLLTNQMVQAGILSLLKNTNQDEEKKEIKQMTQSFQSVLRSKYFDQDNPQDVNS